MTTGWPRRSESRWPTSRPMTSVAPPGAQGTTRRMGFSGYASWALAACGAAKAAAAAIIMGAIRWVSDMGGSFVAMALPPAHSQQWRRVLHCSINGNDGSPGDRAVGPGPAWFTPRLRHPETRFHGPRARHAAGSAATD